MFFPSKYFAFIVVLSTLAVPHLSHAETDSEDWVLEEIIVVARKKEELASSVPIPITAVREQQLITRNITEITGIEKLVPNLSVSNNNVNGSAAQVFLRGIGQSSWASTQDPKIGIYVDGVYTSRPQGGLLDFMDVDRVEVLRGPQGTLFGRNTTAGLIHIINKKPSQERETDIRVRAGSNGHRSYGVALNLPISDNLSSRFSISDTKTDGFITNSLTGNDRGNEDSQSYRASFLWDLEKYSAQFTYDHFEANERAPLASCRFTGPNNPFQAGGLSFFAVVFGIYDDLQTNCNNTNRDVSIDTSNDESVRTDVDSFTLNQTYDSKWGEFTSITSYREIENFNGSWGWVMGNGPGSNFLQILNNGMKTEAMSQELRLSGSSDKLDWVVGAYLFKEDSSESVDGALFKDVMAPSFFDSFLFYVPNGQINPDGSLQTLGDVALTVQKFGSTRSNYEVTNKNYAVFAEGTYSISEELSLSLGARYTEDKREFLRSQTLLDGSFDPGNLCPGMPTLEIAPGFFVATEDSCYQQASYDKITPRAILSYQVNDDVMAYGSYSVGYSSGGFNQDFNMRAFLPEVSENLEFGIKSLLLNGKLRLNATAFYNTYENQQLVVARIIGNQPIADLLNVEEAKLYGIELEILARLSDSMTLSIVAGNVKGEYDKFNVDDVFIDPLTFQESTVTRDLSSVDFGNNDNELSADISLMHEINLTGGSKITSSIGISYTDDQYYSLENIPSSLVPGYWLADARITWHLKNGSTNISAWGTNLTDKDYIADMLNQSGNTEIGGTDPGLGMSADYWGIPRRYGLELRHSF